ncbi:TIGR04104 family putative zinc finger protein [Aminipila terrae]|uniref:Cxxc_20_cxxc protein n=1 Tax=Aminipila terrae TaxID=2697030 RepID=A0A6P1MID4_9FIRM|nr:TIGR04104 family putative zinc finger protein [Aminipila terrae]QHI71748.1 hypothetical protein Ami3637_04525 [Aminipila terrae]
MLIQKCKKCSKDFKWQTILKALWMGYKPVECEYCKSKHYIYFISRLLVAISIAFPVMLQTYGYRYFRWYYILIYLIWGAIILCISPYFVRYYIKDAKNENKE